MENGKYTFDPRLSIFWNLTFKFDPDKFIIILVLIFALRHNVCFSSSFLSSSSSLRRCPVVSLNTVFISTSLYCHHRPPPPPPAPYWRSCQSWRCQDSPCSTVLLQLEKMFSAEYCDYQCINKCILQGPHKLPPKSILLWGLLKCTTSNCNPVHVFLHFGTFGLEVLQLILASKLSQFEQFENCASNNQFRKQKE